MNRPSEDELNPGTVTRLAQQRKNADRVSVFIDGAFAFGVHRDVLLTCPLREGEAISVELQRAALAEDEKQRAKSRALDLIAYKARSADELRRRLSRDGFSDVAAEGAVARLRELGYIDDRHFAQDYAEARFKNKGYGPARIRRELRARGVEDNIIEQALSIDLFREDALLEQARAHAEKRMPRLEREGDALKRKKKLYDSLVRRGFSSATIWRVIDEYVR